MSGGNKKYGFVKMRSAEKRFVILTLVCIVIFSTIGVKPMLWGLSIGQYGFTALALAFPIYGLINTYRHRPRDGMADKNKSTGNEVKEAQL